MKKFVALLSVLCLCVLFYFLGSFSQSKTEVKTKKFTESQNTKSQKEDFVFVDYPLIDICFDNENDWVVIIRSDLFTEHEKYYVSKDRGNLNLNKEQLMVSTFPQGRGTTPKGIVYVYKNQELIKEVPYIKMSFENDLIESLFKTIDKQAINKLIGTSLPSPI